MKIIFLAFLLCVIAILIVGPSSHMTDTQLDDLVRQLHQKHCQQEPSAADCY